MAVAAHGACRACEEALRQRRRGGRLRHGLPRARPHVAGKCIALLAAVRRACKLARGGREAPSNDHVLAEAIGQGPVVLGFIATPQGGPRRNRRRVSRMAATIRNCSRRPIPAPPRACPSSKTRRPAPARSIGCRSTIRSFAACPWWCRSATSSTRPSPPNAAACTRRLHLCREIVGREQREGVRREDRYRQDPHRRLRGPDRGRRPDVDQVHQTGQGALSAGLESAERGYRQGGYRRPSRHHRHERGRPARSPRHAT